MTDPVSLGVAGTAALVALTAGWLSIPRPPALVPARWFAAALATVMRGEEEASGGTVDSWESRVLACVRYHPAVDDAVAWLTAPHALALHAGQAELIGDLRALTTSAERSERLFRDDPAAREAVLADPAALGAAYDPARLLGADISWDAIADWGAGEGHAVIPALRRQLGARWAVVGTDGGRPAVLDALVALGAQRCFGDDIAAALEELAPRPSDRLIVAVAGDAQPLLQALVDSTGLRDRVLAIVSVGATVRHRQEPQRAQRDDWLGAHFTHEAMDLEAHRPLHALSLQWFDAEDPEDVDSMRFVTPSDAGIRDPVLSVGDLGMVAVHEAPPAAVAKALWLVVGLVVLNARSAG